MTTDNRRSKPLFAVVLAGSFLTVIGATWLFILLYGQLASSIEVVQSERSVVSASVQDSTPDASFQLDPSAPEPADTTEPVRPETLVPVVALTQRLLIDSDLGTGSVEFSAVALNEAKDRLVIADDAGRLFELDLDNAGLPITPVRRSINVAVGAGDIEGISWMFDNTYVLAHENDGRLTVVDLGDDLTVITDDQLVRTVDTLISEDNGHGLEGVSYVGGRDGIEFVVIKENPPSIHTLNQGGEVVASIQSTLDIVDLSDIYQSPTGALSLLSDEGQLVLDVTIDDLGRFDVTNTIDLVLPSGEFQQPEGLVRSSDGTRLYVVGEAPGPGRFSLGFWSSEG